MTSKLIYPFIALKPRELFKYRTTLEEMLQDSGFTKDMISDPRFPIGQTLEEFETSANEMQEAQLSAQGGEIDNEGSPSIEDPLSSVLTSEEGDEEEDEIKNQHLLCLYNNIEWSLFIYAKQDEASASNDGRRSCAIFEKLFAPWIQELKLKQEEDFSAPPTQPRDILVVFCRQERLLRDAHESLVWYLKHYNISDGLIITQSGVTANIAKQILPWSITEPNLRVLAAKSNLFYNKIRYNQDVPLYRRLNEYEVKILETRYGSRHNFTKLFRSSTVSQYYGFRVGDVVLIQPTKKRFSHFKTVLEHFEDLSTYIEQLSFRIIIEK